MLNLDTHILIDLLRGQLSESEQELVFGDKLAISDIVLWELAKLVELKRLTFDFEDRGFRSLLQGVEVLPISLDIARTSCRLDFRSDPADEVIAATSIIHKIPLVTRDRKIRKSKIVPLA